MGNKSQLRKPTFKSAASYNYISTNESNNLQYNVKRRVSAIGGKAGRKENARKTKT
jgi:hypothetical protein